MKSITREQFQEAIEAGIARGQSLFFRPDHELLSDKAAEALRHVAETATATQVGGTFPVSGSDLTCGCPAYQAGIWTKDFAVPGCGTFAGGFDAAVEGILRIDLNATEDGAIIVEVTD